MIPYNTDPDKKHTGDYTAQERAQAVALAETERNQAVAAEVLGIPHSTLSEWCRGLYGRVDPVQVAAAKRDLVSAMEAVTWRALGHASDPVKMQDASLSQLAHLIGVTVDKAQLLKGAPTSISQSSTLTRDQALDRIRQAIQDNAITVEPDRVTMGQGDRVTPDSTPYTLDPTPSERGPAGGTVETVPSSGTVEEELLAVTSQEPIGLLSEKEKEVEVT